MSESDAKVEADPEKTPQRQRTESERSEGSESNPDLHFEPVVQLPLIDLKTLEEDESEILKLRAKLYRYDTSEGDPQFKERGTGEIKLLKHNQIRAVRLLMRRDKTLKLCANHYIMPSMDLRNHMNNEKVFVWSTFADLSEETPKPETLAIRFGNVENATKFKDAFEEAKKYIQEVGLNDLSKDLSQIDINQKEDSESKTSESETDSANGSDNEETNQKQPEEDQQKNESKK